MCRKVNRGPVRSNLRKILNKKKKRFHQPEKENFFSSDSNTVEGEWRRPSSVPRLCLHDMFTLLYGVNQWANSCNERKSFLTETKRGENNILRSYSFDGWIIESVRALSTKSARHPPTTSHFFSLTIKQTETDVHTIKKKTFLIEISISD